MLTLAIYKAYITITIVLSKSSIDYYPINSIIFPSTYIINDIHINYRRFIIYAYMLHNVRMIHNKINKWPFHDS